MATTPTILIWGGQVQDTNSSQQNKSTTNGTQNTCYDCIYSCVEDMDNEDILTCKQHNTYVSIHAPICSKFLKEIEVQYDNNRRDN